MVVLLLPRKLVGRAPKVRATKTQATTRAKGKGRIRAKVEQLRLLTKMRKLGNLRLLIIAPSPARF